MRNCPLNQKLCRAFIPFLLILVLEIFLFNLPFWTSLSNTPQESTVTASAGLESVGKESFSVIDPDHAQLKVNLPEPTELSMIKLDIDAIPQEPDARGMLSSLRNAGAVFTLEPRILDDSRLVDPMPLGIAHVAQKLPDTHYISLHTSGKVTELLLDMKDLQKDQEFKVASVVLNPKRPFHFSVLRFFMLGTLAYLIYAFAPQSRIYRIRLDLSQRSQKLVTLGAVVGVCAVLFAISRLTYPNLVCFQAGPFMIDDHQYNHLANALISGHTWLNLEVPRFLAELPNPYDPAVRAAHAGSQAAYLDYAFYNGKYYSYFGVLPALLAFIPYKLITGNDLSTYWAVVFFSFLFVASSFYFFAQLFQRSFKKTSLGLYLIASVALIVGIGSFGQVYSAKIYALPVFASLSCVLFGLGLWIASTRRKVLDKRLLCAGSVVLAATLLARPNFLLAVVLAFPLFWDQIKARLFFSRKGLANTLAVILPFVAMGLVAGAYNYVRFGSLLDFGAKYNLTGFDMVHHSQTLLRIPIGIWMFLFQPLNFDPTYPFLQPIREPLGFMAKFVMEPYYGGFLIFCPVVLFIVFAFTRKENLKSLRLTGLVMTLLLVSLVTLIIDNAIVGVNPRYFADFGWAAIIAAFLCIQSQLEVATELKKGQSLKLHLLRSKGILSLVLLMVFWSIALYGLNLLTDTRYPELKYFSSGLYYFLESWLLPFQ